MQAINWTFMRGFGRETRHWFDFPDLWREAFPHNQLYCLELPGAGTRAYESVPLSAQEMVNSLRTKWLEQKLQGPRGLLCISFGGMMGMDWLNRYPQDFDYFVVINSSARGLNPLHHRLRPEAFKDLAVIIGTQHNLHREQKALKLTTNLRLDITELAKKSTDYFLQYPMTRANAFKQLALALQFKAPQKLQQKMLVLAAKEDRLCHFKSSEKIAKHFKAPLKIHEKAGHDLPLDDPAWIIENIKNWLKEIE